MAALAFGIRLMPLARQQRMIDYMRSRLHPRPAVGAQLAGLSVLAAQADAALSSSARRMLTLLAGLVAVTLVLLLSLQGIRRALIPLIPIVPERRRGLDLASALERTYRRTGAPVLASGLTAITGFGVLTLSNIVMLWIGSQIQGATNSLGAALGIMFIRVVLTIALIAVLLAKLSNTYRANRRARGLEDPGHVMLEGVLVVSAGLTITVFVVWFLFFAGAGPVPFGIHI